MDKKKVAHKGRFAFTAPYPSITIPADAPQNPTSNSVSTSLWLTHLESQHYKNFRVSDVLVPYNLLGCTEDP